MILILGQCQVDKMNGGDNETPIDGLHRHLPDAVVLLVSYTSFEMLVLVIMQVFMDLSGSSNSYGKS